MHPFLYPLLTRRDVKGIAVSIYMERTTILFLWFSVNSASANRCRLRFAVITENVTASPDYFDSSRRKIILVPDLLSVIAWTM